MRAVFVAHILTAIIAASASPLTPRQAYTSNPAEARLNDATGYKGAAASEVGICSDIAVDTLKAGGSAADSIISAVLCVGVISAYHSGIGGGGFALVRSGPGKYDSIDFRETMPAAGNETMYSQYGPDQTQSTIGGLAVGVPGELRAWESLHKNYGKLPWKRLFQPAIKLARNGFPVNVDLAAAIAGYNVTRMNPLFAESYAPNGTALVEGDVCYRKRYANTLVSRGSLSSYMKPIWIARKKSPIHQPTLSTPAR